MKDIHYKPTQEELKQSIIDVISNEDIEILELIHEPRIEIHPFYQAKGLTGISILTIKIFSKNDRTNFK
jgi:hypothetical protein